MSVSDPLNYSAATKLLDAAVDQAVREEYHAPQWSSQKYPNYTPHEHPIIHVLDLGQDRMKLSVEACGDGRSWVTLCNTIAIDSANNPDAQRVAINIARRWLTEAIAALPEVQP
jgi:hypothetical protein